jgi:hypothetical protein
LFCLALFALSACDSTSEDLTATFSASLEGSGSGTIETQSVTLGLEIECRITDGQVTGTCEDEFLAPEADGFVQVQATLGSATNLNWGTPCQQAQGTLCDIPYDGGTATDIEVRASFDAKTRRVVMNPPDALISIPGDDGAVVISAWAVDMNGENVAGVTYSFEVDRPDIAGISVNSPNSVRVTGIADGQALVTATAQGVSGTAAVVVNLSN